MRGRGRRERWRWAVIASSMSWRTKVVLLVMLDLCAGQKGFAMRPDGKVSHERERVADAAGIHTIEMVTRSWSEAVDAGYLVIVTAGRYGQPTTYQAVLPQHHRTALEGAE